MRLCTWRNHHIIEGSPELSGSMASSLLKNGAVHSFLDHHEPVVGSYNHGPGHPCNTNNVIGDLWSEFSHSMIFLRESDTPGLEPLSQDNIDVLDLSMRKQRVWIGYVAPGDWAVYQVGRHGCIYLSLIHI